MDDSDEQQRDTLALLACALERLGGHLEVSEAELEAAKAKYGYPAPLLIARMPDEALVGHVSTLEALVDEQWPIMARALHLTREQAIATATEVQQRLVAHRALHEQRAAMARDTLN